MIAFDDVTRSHGMTTPLFHALVNGCRGLRNVDHEWRGERFGGSVGECPHNTCRRYGSAVWDNRKELGRCYHSPMKQPRAFDYMALIQTVMTVAGVAFAIGTLAPASDVRLFGRSIVPLILLIVSLALTGSAMIGIDGLREQWEYQQGDNEDALPFGATSRAIAALEGSAWLMTIALIFQMLEWADK